MVLDLRVEMMDSLDKMGGSNFIPLEIMSSWTLRRSLNRG